jgi:hypothetical protein
MSEDKSTDVDESWKANIDNKLSEIYKRYTIRPAISASREKINNVIAVTEEKTEIAKVTVKSKPKELLYQASEFVNTEPFFKYTATVARNYQGQFLTFYTLLGGALSYSKSKFYIF